VSHPCTCNFTESEENANKYFATQALASLVCNGSRGTLLAIANFGATGGLIPLLGCAEANILKLIELFEEFSLVHNPDQVALERLFRI
jgi:hypothetical protein